MVVKLIYENWWQTPQDLLEQEFSANETPLKMNMEPKNYPIEEEHHLNQISMFGVPAVNFWVV